MPSAAGKCSRIRHIVRIRHMLLRWRKKTVRTTANRSPTSDVPAGHVAVHVGPSHRRFIVRASYLNHPLFEKLLAQAEEEYGFCTQGPLTIPCNESLFEEALRVMARPDSNNPTRFMTLVDLQRRCHVDVIGSPDFGGGESWPLLQDAKIC